MTLNDVLEINRIDRVALSPDGTMVAVVVQRGAGPNEVYGRTHYDLDPSRSDVWLISRETGQRRNITQGLRDSAGYWCSTWSPNGSKLAILSTQPEGNEPRGGDNVRLYVWDRSTEVLRRVSNTAVMTQTRLPIYRLDFRGGATGGPKVHRCHGYENAPFAWLDDNRLLAATLGPGTVSGLLDEYSRPSRHSINVLETLRQGTEPTVTAVGSGAEQTRPNAYAVGAMLQEFDVNSRISRTLAPVPVHPFRGELTVSIAPGGRRVAVLATVAAIAPTPGQHPPPNGDSWWVEKRLGILEMGSNAPISWLQMPPRARYPLEIFDWSPEGSKVAFRARSSTEASATPLFLASLTGVSIQQLGLDETSVGGAEAGSEFSFDVPVLWVDNQRLLARAESRAVGSATAAAPSSRADWWLLSPGSNPVSLTSNEPEVPARLDRSSDGSFFGLFGSQIKKLDIASQSFEPIASADLPSEPSIIWPEDSSRKTSTILAAGRSQNGARVLQRLFLDGKIAEQGKATLRSAEDLLDVDPRRGIALTSEPAGDGLYLRETSLVDGSRRILLSLNKHLANIEWGETKLIEYRGGDGQSLKAAVILPPKYNAKQKYPTITWVYPGNQVRDLNNYFLDRYMGGFYNLQLYAARGYVVLIPSIPLEHDDHKPDLFHQVPKGVLPAVDRLVQLGIADPHRIGIMGQSFGGYGVYALVTQTNRFKAAVAIAGISDLTNFYNQFDQTARGYPGIEHEKSSNWSIIRHFGMNKAPHEDYWRYRRNSPLSHVEKVATPLLMMHGEYDVRGQMAQAETFFYALYRQGKTARLLRYWGENHGLSQSPANVRNVLEETLGWFDKYLGERPGQVGKEDPAPRLSGS